VRPPPPRRRRHSERADFARSAATEKLTIPRFRSVERQNRLRPRSRSPHATTNPFGVKGASVLFGSHALETILTIYMGSVVFFHAIPDRDLLVIKRMGHPKLSPSGSKGNSVIVFWI
jgi:hypothetical protein